MATLRRPVLRNSSTTRPRCLPVVDFISIQREISRSVRHARVLRIGERSRRNETAAPATQEEHASILTPALRRGFSADQPAY